MYHELVCQLVSEDIHSETNTCHEAARRGAYARRVLDAFAEELNQIKDCSDSAMVRFRSKVLTPIVQRQKSGVPDFYTPAARRGVKGSPGPLTIEEATSFYLGEDPTDPRIIPYYRRSILLLPHVRWFLGFLMKAPPDNGANEYYANVLDHQDSITAGLLESHPGWHRDGVLRLSSVEIECISEEGLELYFAIELQKEVSNTVFSSLPPTILLIIPQSKKVSEAEQGPAPTGAGGSELVSTSLAADEKNDGKKSHGPQASTSPSNSLIPPLAMTQKAHQPSQPSDYQSDAPTRSRVQSRPPSPQAAAPILAPRSPARSASTSSSVSTSVPGSRSGSLTDRSNIPDSADSADADNRDNADAGNRDDAGAGSDDAGAGSDDAGAGSDDADADTQDDAVDHGTGNS